MQAGGTPAPSTPQTEGAGVVGVPRGVGVGTAAGCLQREAAEIGCAHAHNVAEAQRSMSDRWAEFAPWRRLETVQHFEITAGGRSVRSQWQAQLIDPVAGVGLVAVEPTKEAAEEALYRLALHAVLGSPRTGDTGGREARARLARRGATGCAPPESRPAGVRGAHRRFSLPAPPRS